MKCPYCIKVCKHCKERIGEARLLVAYKGNFTKSKTGKYGLRSKCKDCVKEYDKIQKKKYYEENRNKIREYKKQHYDEHRDDILEKSRQYHQEHRDERLQKSKEYYEAHRDELLEKQKQWYQEHRDELLEYNKQWREDNPERVFYYNNKRRSLEENQGRGITKEQWLDMMNFFEWECAYSGETLSEENRSIDHIIALNNGGLNEPWNCVPMLKSYNISKYTSDINEWYLAQDFYSEERLNKIYEWQEYAYNKYYEE